MIRYLENEEKNICRGLWNEAFPEDSDEFCDYYFTEKTKDNRIIVCEEDGRILSMINRNPYRISFRGREVTSDYIVGVATAVSERNKGYMRSLMLTVLKDMDEEKMPFTFLMPARESLYLPYDFRYIFDQPRWVLRYSPSIRRETPDSEDLIPDLAGWQNAWLRKRYEVFTVRDEAYLRRMQKELESEDGSVSLIFDGDDFVGMESEWGLKEREMRYLYTDERYRTVVANRPAIMARIVDIPEFVQGIRLREDCEDDEINVRVGIQDILIPDNQGTWDWKITKEGSGISRDSRFVSQGDIPVFTIAEMTQWLFGYKIPKAVSDVSWTGNVDTYHDIFLDEVV